MRLEANVIKREKVAIHAEKTLVHDAIFLSFTVDVHPERNVEEEKRSRS